MIFKIFNLFASKTRFNRDYVLENEFKKISLLRPVVGIIAFVRFLEIFLLHVQQDGFSTFAAIYLFFLLSILLFSIGFLTPIFNFILIIGLPILDVVLSTRNLGTTMLANVMILSLFMHSGKYFSIDNLLLKKENIFSKILLKSYKIIGIPDNLGIVRAYSLSFLMFATTSFFAIVIHLQDVYWVGGLTIKSMLSSSYLCKHAFVFRDLEAMFPRVFDYVSIAVIILQSTFQFLMIPLVLFKFGYQYVKTWGFIFIIICIFIISLSYLPVVEVVLWSILFCTIKKSSKKISILYDDRCNFCKKTISFLHWTNLNGVYEFLPISKNANVYQKYSLTEAEVKTYMVGFYNDKLLKGYDLFAVIIKNNFFLFFLFPLFWLGKITKIGAYFYKFIAKNRYKLSGTCETTFEIKKNNHYVLNSIESKGLFKTIIYTFILFGIVLYALVNNVFYDRLFQNNTAMTTFKPYYLPFCKSIGLEAPQVFNNIDLSMGDNFLTIKKFKNNHWELLPITGLRGERLNYLNFDILFFTNHNSDLFYFAHTLPYRRALIEGVKNVESFHEHGIGKEQLDFLIKFDYYKKEKTGTVTYKAEVFSSNSSKVKLFEYDKKRHDLVKVYEKIIIFNGN